MKKSKEFQVEILETKADGGRIRINTASIDRDRDRVLPGGALVADYLKNPVVQWGHNYSDPWATIGRTTSLEVSDLGIEAEFELRGSAGDTDPMNIIRLLWDQGYIKAASVGFLPVEYEENEFGGNDFTQWELLEWSLVPIPANQDALRAAVKSLKMDPDLVETWTSEDLGVDYSGPVIEIHVEYEKEQADPEGSEEEGTTEDATSGSEIPAENRDDVDANDDAITPNDATETEDLEEIIQPLRDLVEAIRGEFENE